MRNFRYIVGALALLWVWIGGVKVGHTQQANAVAGVEKQIATLQRRTHTLLKQRTRARRDYEARARRLRALQNQPASWNRDRKLKQAKRALHQVAQTLSRNDRLQRTVRFRLRAAQKRLVRAIDVRLRGSQLSADRRAYLTLRKRQLVTKLRPVPQPIRLPPSDIDPLSDAAELKTQANLMLRVEKALRREEKRLTSLQRKLRKQDKLRRHHRRANEPDLFNDSPRRTIAYAGNIPRPSGSGGSATPTPTPTPNPPTPNPRRRPGPGIESSPPAGRDVSPSEPIESPPLTEPPAPIESPPVTEPPAQEDTVTEVQIILRDVVRAEDLTALRNAKRSRSRVGVIRTILDQIRRQRARLKKQRSIVEKRAKALSR